MKIPVLMYHSVSNDDFFLSVKTNNFEKQLKYLYKNGFKSIDFGEEIISKKNVIITFDDGYKDLLTNALPLLKKYNFKATCFLVNDLIGKFNLWDEKKSSFVKKELLNNIDVNEWITAGMNIGSHTNTHENLTLLGNENLNYEIADSKKKLEDLFSKKVESFSYPYGKYNEKISEIVKKNYNFAVTTIRSRYKINIHMKNKIPRIHINTDTGMFKFFLKINTFYEDIKYKNV